MLRNIIINLSFLVAMANVSHAQKVDEQSVPAPIRAVAAQHHNGDKVTLWVLDRNRNKYVATALNETSFRTVEIGLDGQWLATTHALPEHKVPGPVMKTVREQYPRYEGSNYLLVNDSKDGRFYSVELTSDDRDLYLRLNEAGRILQEEEQ